MKTTKMYCLIMRMKKNDSFEGKRAHSVILDFVKKAKIGGATVWSGIEGYGKRDKSNFQIEGLSVNMPLIIEIIDDLEKIESIIPDIKRIVGDNGLVTIHEIDVV